MYSNSTDHWYHFVNDYISVSGDMSDNIIGRGLIVHANPDNCDQPTGGAGSRLVQAVIGIRNPATPYMAVSSAVPTTQNASACPVYRSTVQLAGTTGADSGITGMVTMWVTGTLIPQNYGMALTVHVQASGIVTNPDTDHGVHIHWYGDLSDPAGLSTGSHWNPTNANHSCPAQGWPRHFGDLGNFKAEGGIIDMTKTLTGYTSNPLAGTMSAIGRAVVIHAAADCASGAGSRIAQGVIGIANGMNNMAGTDDPAADGAIAVLGRTSNGPAGSSGRVDYNNNATDVQVLGMFNSIVGEHGFHVHTYGDLTQASGSSAGGHYNPDGNAHAIPPQVVRHVGDFGNVYFYSSNVAYYQYSNNYLAVGGSTNRNVIGRANVVHNDKDNCTGTSGYAGPRILIGVIGHRNPGTASQAAIAPSTQNDCDCTGTCGTTGVPTTGVPTPVTTGKLEPVTTDAPRSLMSAALCVAAVLFAVLL